MDGERSNIAQVGPIRASAPGVPIIVFGLNELIEEIIPWAEAGVAGYIPAATGLKELLPLVRAVISGEQPCSGRIAAGLLHRLAGGERHSTDGAGLLRATEITSREQEIAELLSAGLSDKEISRRLSIALATTKAHVHNLLGKLNVRGRGEVNAAWSGPTGDRDRRSNYNPRGGPFA